VVKGSKVQVITEVTIKKCYKSFTNEPILSPLLVSTLSILVKVMKRDAVVGVG
jgi:hypothetical protein